VFLAPDQIEQLVVREDSRRFFDQDDQQAKGLRPQLEVPGRPLEASTVKIKGEGSESVGHRMILPVLPSISSIQLVSVRKGVFFVISSSGGRFACAIRPTPAHFWPTPSAIPPCRAVRDVPKYDFAQRIPSWNVSKNYSFPPREPRDSHPDFPDGNMIHFVRVSDFMRRTRRPAETPTVVDPREAGVTRGATVIVIIILAAVPAFSDDVFLRGGGQITGEIISRSEESVTVDIGGGTMTARMSSVVRIEEGTSPLQEFRARAEALPDNDTQSWRELARWAASGALSTQASKAYSKVVANLPDDEEANRALGRVKLDGKWVSEEEAFSARGFVEFEGHWMTPGERQAILTDRRAREQEDRQANEAAIQAIEAEQQAERQRVAAEEEKARRANSIHWGWGAGPRVWPIPSKPLPTNPADRQTGTWQ